MKKLKIIIIILVVSAFLIVNLAGMIQHHKNSPVKALRKSNQDSEAINQQIRDVIVLADSFTLDAEQKSRKTK